MSDADLGDSVLALPRTPTETPPGSFRAVGEDVLRGMAGGLLFGVPLLYTMEVWWLGKTSTSLQAIVALGVTVVPVFLLVSTSGFREGPDLTRADAAIDTVVAIGIAIVSTTAVLLLLERITLDTPPTAAARMLVLEGAPFAVGVAVAREVFERKDNGEESQGGKGAAGDEGLRGTLWDLGTTAIGALFVALAIAPTEEVPMLATGIEPPTLVGLIAASLVVSYGIVFVAGFTNEDKRRQQTGVLQHPLTETVAAYVVALAVAGATLWFFDNLGPHLTVAATHLAVLGFPAAVGGAAGRLVV